MIEVLGSTASLRERNVAQLAVSGVGAADRPVLRAKFGVVRAGERERRLQENTSYNNDPRPLSTHPHQPSSG